MGDESRVTQQTLDLVRRAQDGDQEALERLAARYLPRLKRWASGRLPARVRGQLDTEDVVQDALSRSLVRVDRLQADSGGAFQAYTRQAVMNAIRDAVRRARHPHLGGEVLEREADPGPSPLEQVVSREAIERYEVGLAKLSDEERAGVVARIELHCSWKEIAEDLGRSPDSARMMVTRALTRLAKEMGRG